MIAQAGSTGLSTACGIHQLFCAGCVLSSECDEPVYTQHLYSSTAVHTAAALVRGGQHEMVLASVVVGEACSEQAGTAWRAAGESMVAFNGRVDPCDPQAPGLARVIVAVAWHAGNALNQLCNHVCNHACCQLSGPLSEGDLPGAQETGGTGGECLHYSQTTGGRAVS